MKKQIKKSLSLFLAVLMLLSSWVWVAPEKAEAGAPGGYDVKVDFSVSNMVNNGRVHADIYYITNNGTGEKKSVTWEMNDVESKEGDYSLTYYNVPGWPCQIYIHAGDNGMTTFEFQVKGISINGTKVVGGTWTLDGGWSASVSRDFIPNTRDSLTADGKGGTVSGAQEGEWNWQRPVLQIEPVLSTDSVTLDKVNTGNPSKVTFSLTKLLDQYGVTWTGALNPSFSISADGVIIEDGHATISKSGNTATVEIKPWFQTLFPEKESAKLYLKWSTANNKSGSETITVDFPPYKATFNSNGGKIGTTDSEALNEVVYGQKYVGLACQECKRLLETEAEIQNRKCSKCGKTDTVYEVYEGDPLHIGDKIGKAPEFASREGYEFKGYYSKQNDIAYGRITSFKGTKFEDNVTTVPHTHPDGLTPFYGDTTWYAAWQSAPINVTFVTADNQLIGVVEGRHSNYMTATNMYDGEAGLNIAVRASHAAAGLNRVKFNANNEPVYTDGSTSYKFAGWRIVKAYDDSLIDGDETTILKGDVTFQAVYTKADASKYTVAFKNNEGVVFDVKYDYNYRDQINVPSGENLMMDETDKYTYEFIGWAKDIGKNFYTVDENDMDENGAKIVYTHKDSSEFIVKGNVTYVPVFRMTARDYSVTYKYVLDENVPGSITVEGCHWDDAVEMPEINDSYTHEGYRYYIIGWKVNGGTKTMQLEDITVAGDMTLTAVYGNKEAAKYTINFYGKDVDGETDVLLNADNNIYEHGDAVTAPEVPQTIETDDSLYTFAGWSPEINTTASINKEYRAIYTKKDYADVHFYNYDGTLIYELDGKENSLFVNDKVPEYTAEAPVKAEDVIGKYTFSGWKNSAGAAVVPGTDTITGDTYLYAQFDTEYTEYRVRFVNDDGELISTAKYHYGDEIAVPADPAKEADVEYIYDFRGWTPSVSAVCRGDVTYTATYRRTPQYYKVTWLNDKKEIITESNYAYNAKINQAIVNEPVDKYAPPTGKAWAFVDWILCDAEGRAIDANGVHVEEEAAVKFVRGQRMGAKDLYFYPTFELVASVNTVTFYKEDGKTLLGTAKIPYGKNINDYAEVFAVEAVEDYEETSTYHTVVDKWVLNTENGAEVTAVTEDISVKASTTNEAHEWDEGVVTVAPTCNLPGYANYRCTAPGCAYIRTNVAIAPLADEGQPTGQLYVGTNVWTLKNYTDGIDYSDIKYVGPSTQLIVNANDIGSASSPWNEDGKLSRGVGKIEYALTDGVVDPSTITKWTEIYNCEEIITTALNAVLSEYKISLMEYYSYTMGTDEQKLMKAEIDRAVEALISSYKANATGVVSNLNLENGKTYIIYIKISDREGNGEVNATYLSSGTLSYGTKAPEITVSGEGYGTKFCAEADVRITDDGDALTVLLDGEAVSTYTNPGTTSANGTFVATFKTDKAGLHTVTVVDKNGNKATKLFEIKGNHTYRNYTTLATCENAGSRYDLCTLCGAKANVTVLPALGHSYTVNYIDKASTCVDDGYRTYVCDNNCGTKLVLKPTDDAETLAQAKTAVDPEAEEIEWRALTADDLKDLKSTGIHTYEKVKDAEGQDTAEDAWVVDKAATCIDTGSKHKDCTKCGETVTETIPVDAENGHKFYRERVTKEPTCTEKGEKTKTCRYCPEVVKVADIDALGHTAGDYRVITAATCETAGSKIKTCATCGIDIGEEITDENGNVTGFDGKAVDIDAIGHSWKINGKVYQDAADSKYYQDYVCRNDSTHTKREEAKDYEPPVAATVTFDFATNGGYYSVPAVGSPEQFGYIPEMMKGTQTISAYVGESISASDVATALKADNDTKTYTFSHWEDADGKAVKFPIEVKGDATYYAVFTERFVNYTITYYKDDEKTEFKKTGYLHNGDEVTLANGPVKAETNRVTYKFAGWVVMGSNPEVVYTDKVTINGTDLSLKAKYTEVKKQYAVTYAYSKSDILETFAVEAGAKAKACDITPVKESDSQKHYTFKGWNRAEQLKSVESNIYTTPEFEATSHDFVKDDKNIRDAACGVNAIYKYTCSVCGYSYTKEIAGTALEHEWGAPVYDEATGTNTTTCTRTGCGVTEADTRTFTAKFYVNADDAQAIKTVYYIAWGTAIDATKLPAAPTKEADATNTYTFKGWALKNDATETIVDFTKYEFKADVEFVAVFDSTVREYSVIFAYDAKNVIKTYTNVKAGASVTFDGAMPVKDFDTTYHYTFSNWHDYEAGAEGKEHIITITNIQSDLYILADFTGVKHEYDDGKEIGTATCTQGIGTRYTCTGCTKFYDISGKPLDHDFSIETGDRKEPTLTEAGYIVYRCATCPDPETAATYKKVLDKLESTTTYINIEVKDSEGKPLAGANVDLYINNVYSKSVSTNSEGEVNLLVDKGASYSFLVEYDGKDVTGGLRNAELGEDKVNTVVVNISKCSCACHGDGIWSAIFRFFHKIIKMFTGEFKCCNDPDARYN